MNRTVTTLVLTGLGVGAVLWFLSRRRVQAATMAVGGVQQNPEGVLSTANRLAKQGLALVGAGTSIAETLGIGGTAAESAAAATGIGAAAAVAPIGAVAEFTPAATGIITAAPEAVPSGLLSGVPQGELSLSGTEGVLDKLGGSIPVVAGIASGVVNTILEGPERGIPMGVADFILPGLSFAIGGVGGAFGGYNTMQEWLDALNRQADEMGLVGEDKAWWVARQAGLGQPVAEGATTFVTDADGNKYYTYGNVDYQTVEEAVEGGFGPGGY